jgi:hypothetical protein
VEESKSAMLQHIGEAQEISEIYLNYKILSQVPTLLQSKMAQQGKQMI